MPGGFLLLVTLGVLAHPSAAQAPAAGAKELQGNQELLRARNRVTMNPAEDPLVVVGLEQGGNDLRSRTPALARTDGTATLVDTEAAYKRALALYEERAIFDRPLALAAPARPARPARSAAKVGSAGSAGASPTLVPDNRWWTAVTSVVLGVLAVAYLSKRARARRELEANPGS